MHRRHLLKLSRTRCGWCGKNQAATSVRFSQKALAHHKQDASLHEESGSRKCLKANNSSGELKVASCSTSQKSGIRPKQPSASNSCSHFRSAQKKESLWRTSGSLRWPITAWMECIFHRNQLRGERKGRWWGPTQSRHRRSVLLLPTVNGQPMTPNHSSGSIIRHANWRQSSVLQAQLVHLSA